MPPWRCPVSTRVVGVDFGSVFLEIFYFRDVSKYRNKYRTDSIRAFWWDYGRKGAYFVTICSQDRACYFGYVENKRMVLSGTGVLVSLPLNSLQTKS